MSRREAKNDLIARLVGAGKDILVNRKGYSRFYCSRDSGILHNFFLETKNQPVMLVPEDIDDIDDYNNIKIILKYLKNIDSVGSAFRDSKKTDEIEYDVVALANKHCLEGNFYSFDQMIDGKFFLTENLNNLLAVIQNYMPLKKRLGLMEKEKIHLAPSIDSKKLSFDKDSFNVVRRWLNEHKISNKTYTGSSDSEFKFPLPTLFIKDKHWYYLTLVSDGTDKDLIQKYINTKYLESYLKIERPKIKGKPVNVSGIIIASKTSPEGHLFLDDPKFATRTHSLCDETSDIEHYKSFQFSRLPFYLEAKDSLPVNGLYSGKLVFQKENRPFMFRVFKTKEGNLTNSYSQISRYKF